MSEGSFWKIYFVLLLPTLERSDADLLSTPKIVKARSSLTNEVQYRSQAYPEQYGSKQDMSDSKEMSALHDETLSVPSNVQSQSLSLEHTTLASAKSTQSADVETDKHPVLINEIQMIDKSVIKEEPKNQTKDQSPSASKAFATEDEDDSDDWLKEESSEVASSSRNTIPVENDEDVSFSDLEDDDDDDSDVPTTNKKVTDGSDSSGPIKDVDCVTIDCAGSGQVSTRNSETKESNDWLDVDDIDVA